jgi:UDP-3-O-[3-hydroxymyristoyl] glucosamine N-acyltransferase
MMTLSAGEIAHLLNGIVEGDPQVRVSSFCRIEEGVAGAISFLANPKYERHIYGTAASVVIVNRSFTPTEPIGATLIRVADAYLALARLLQMYEQVTKVARKGIHSSAVIEAGAQVSDEAYIGPLCHVAKGAVIAAGAELESQVYVGQGAQIGEGTQVRPGVRIMHSCVVGRSCIIQPNAVIGSDGFGFAPTGSEYARIPQVGNVILEDGVEVGANATIDRGSIGATIIRQGTKLDNLVQIAHNVEVGTNSVIAAQAGVAGSTRIGAGAMIGGQVGIIGHLRVGDNVKIAAQSGIGGDVPDGATMQGSPAFDVALYRRAYVMFRNLPKLAAQLNDLDKRLPKT